MFRLTSLLLVFSLLYIPIYAMADDNIITACGHHDYPPFNWHENNSVVGLGPDIASLIFSELGFELKPVYVGPWIRCLIALEKGEVDVIVAAYATNERKKYIGFTPSPLSEDEKSAFVWKGTEFQFDSWNDLKGKTAGIQTGVSFGEEFDTFLKNHVKVFRVSERHQYFNMLKLGRVDFVPTGKYLGLIHAKRAGFGDNVVALENGISKGFLHVGISKKSEVFHLLPELNRQLKALVDDGTVNRLTDLHMKRYLSQLEK